MRRDGQHSLELKLERLSDSDGRKVRGWQYVNELGYIGWHIRTWPTDGEPIDNYWVEDREISEIISINAPIVEIGRLIDEMDDAKKNAILSAVARWEKAKEVAV